MPSFNRRLSKRSVITLNCISGQDWLSNYANINQIKRALNGLSSTANFNSKIEEAGMDLEKNFELYKADFILFLENFLRKEKSGIKKTSFSYNL